LTINKPQNPSLIDILSEGYATVNRRPWLLIIPVLLNLYIAYGALLSFGPLFARLSSFFDRMRAAPNAAAPEASPAELFGALGRSDWRQAIALLNFVPTLRLNQLIPTAGDSNTHPVVDISTGGGIVLAVILINLVALPLSTLFIALVADAVRGGSVRDMVWLQRAPRIGVAIIAYAAIFAGVGLILGLPFLFLTGLLMSLSPVVGALALTIFMFAVFWVSIYVGFTNEAIAMQDLGPLQAIRVSVNLVRREFWSTVGFLALSSFLIPSGSNIIWQSVAESPIGLIAAVFGSAYIGSGLAAARMAFVREHMRRAATDPALARVRS
jgi:hypothetical protein